MKRKLAGVVFLGLCAAQTALADLTLRYTFTFKFGSFLPAQAVDAIKQQVGSRMGDGTTLLIKGDRAYTSMGQMFSVADYVKGTITLVDPKTKRFASSPLAEYPAKVLAAQKLPTLPPDAQRVFDNMKFDVNNSKTGQTAAIRDMRAEENLLVISMEMTPGMAIRTARRAPRGGRETACADAGNDEIRRRRRDRHAYRHLHARDAGRAGHGRACGRDCHGVGGAFRRAAR